jgi:adenylate cyclase
VCDDYFRAHPGGAEIEVSVLFVDVRGSTSIAERMSPTEFSRVMDRFYTVATHAITETDGLIEKFVGDEVAALYVPGFAGVHHARKAVEAGRKILVDTGHDRPDGPWVPVGAGVHTGVAYVGSVGSGGVAQLTVLGDLPNAGARMASLAGPGELLVSDAAHAAAGLEPRPSERRELALKGRRESLGVHVLEVQTTDG